MYSQKGTRSNIILQFWLCVMVKQYFFRTYMSQRKTGVQSLVLLQQTQYSLEPTTVQTKGEVPPPRNDHRTLYRDKKLYLIGGTTDKQDQHESYILDIETAVWRKVVNKQLRDFSLPVSGMSIITWPATQYAHLKGYALIYGGWTGQDYSDNMLLLNLNTMEFRPFIKQEPKAPDINVLKNRPAASVGNSKDIEKHQMSKYPPKRKDHTMCYIPSENKICLYGGWDGSFQTGAKDELWVLSSNWKWDKFPGLARRGHSNVVIDDENRGNGFLVFGGFKGPKCVTNQSLFFDIRNQKWHSLKDIEEYFTPEGRAYHTANLINNKIVYIGGVNESYKVLDDMWIFCLDARQWSKVVLTPQKAKLVRRAGHTSFVIDKKIFLVGGMTQIDVETGEVNQSRYKRCNLTELVYLDLSDIINDVPQNKEKSAQPGGVGGGKSLIYHSVEHHWDLGAFGVVPAKQENISEFLESLGKLSGITESEME